MGVSKLNFSIGSMGIFEEGQQKSAIQREARVKIYQRMRASKRRTNRVNRYEPSRESTKVNERHSTNSKSMRVEMWQVNRIKGMGHLISSCITTMCDLDENVDIRETMLLTLPPT